MRKTKTKKWLTALFAAGSLWASAQAPGTSSTNPIVVSSGNQTLTSQSPVGTETWYRWINNETVLSITNSVTANAGSHTVYSAQVIIYNNLGVLVSQEIDSLQNDNTIRFIKNGVEVGSTIYYKINANLTCEECDISGTSFSMFFNNYATSNNCASYVHPPCEHVYDPGMEHFTVPCTGLKNAANIYEYFACYWQLPSLGMCYASGTSDYINNCAPATQYTTFDPSYGTNLYTTAHMGSGCSGIFCSGYYYEYIRNTLYTPLTAGKTYSISMWVRLMNISAWAIKDLSARLSVTAPCQGSVSTVPMPVGTGQLINFGNSWLTNKTSWAQLTTTFTATSNHAYLTIGSFTNVGGSNAIPMNDGSTKVSYYFIDDVSIQEAFNVTASASHYSGCSAESFTLTASGSTTTYTWMPGNLTGSSVVVNPTSSTVYTVTSTSSTGCQRSAVVSINVGTCCANSNGGNINLRNAVLVANGTPGALPWSSLTSGPYYSGSIAVPSNTTVTNNLTILGSLTINTPIKFLNSKVAMLEDVPIHQNSTTEIVNSHFYGCDKLWTGIKSKDKITLQHSVIEDAYLAIDAGIYLNGNPHPGIFVDDAVFNKNYRGIAIVWNPINVGDLSITGAIFTCRNLAPVYNFTNGVRFATSGVCLPLTSKVPKKLYGSTASGIVNNTIRTDIGVHLVYVNSTNPSFILNLGSAVATASTNAQKTNYFDYVNEGVFNQLTKVFINNSVFSNIKTLSGGVGTSLGAIYHDDGSSSNYYLTSTKVGSATSGGIPAAHFKCTFNAVGDGVVATNGGTINTSYNDFNNVSGYGMKITSWNGNYSTQNEFVTLASNSFTDAAYVFYANNNASIKASITSNILIHSQNTYTANYNVYVNETGKPAAAQYTINTNKFSGSQFGIYFLNTANSSITSNTVTIKKPNAGIFNSAVSLDNSDNMMVASNVLDCNPTNSTSWYTFGIFANAAKTNTYQCNTITKVGSCMKFQSDCQPSYNYYNSLNMNPTDPCLFGVFLDNSGKTGNIGYYSSSIWYSSVNQWGDFAYGIGGADTYCQNNSNIPVQPTLYYNALQTPTAAYTPSVNLAFNISLPFTLNSSALIATGPCGGASRYGSENSGKGSVENNIEENQFVAGTYNGKNVNSTNPDATVSPKKRVILYPNGSNQKGSASNESQFYIVDSLFEQYSLTKNIVLLNQAVSLNNSINVINNIDANQKQLNQIYAVFLEDDSLVTTNQIQDLANLAWMCPFTEGLAVYQARGLVHNWDDSTFYYNSCEINTPQSSSSRFADLSQNKEVLATQIAVFPNPSNGNLVVNTNVKECIFEVFDLMGKKLISKHLNEGESKLDLSTLSSGTYLYKISQSGATIKTDKLILDK